ncbi:MAG TPA: methyltransferase domain-containing protein [Candidatus Methylomirabilis sp.]|nr:methyltransferase domain-containing protein [Candidatus Methylomirabilis sp.]
MIILERSSCPGCGSAEISYIYEIDNIPIHSVLLFQNREKAIKYPKKDIKLGFCEKCGLISNVSFDPDLHEYSTGYESTQIYSTTFNVFARKLAQNLVDRYNLYSRDIIEIGCGQGEFLTMLCESGKNRGIGFDPAFIQKKNENLKKYQVSIIKDFFSEKYADIQCDFLCCRMTLEHISETADFIRTVKRTIQNKPDTIVFFQVPDVTRILKDLAFWDIYYEHCSYFSPGSIAQLFRNNGFEITDKWVDYDDQYIMLGARLGNEEKPNSITAQEDIVQLKRHVEFFSKNYKNHLNKWKSYLEKARKDGQKAIIWGGGSKGVAFLTTLNIIKEIEYVVDINPNKHGTYMAGTGQEIVSPEFLMRYRPDIVIVMNPIYCSEIQKTLDKLGIIAELKSV